MPEAKKRKILTYKTAFRILNPRKTKFLSIQYVRIQLSSFTAVQS